MKVTAIIPLLAAAAMASPIPEADPAKTVVISNPLFTKTFTIPDFPKPSFPTFPKPSLPSFPTPSFPSFPTPSFPAFKEERDVEHHSFKFPKPSIPTEFPIPSLPSFPKPTHHSIPTEFPTPSFPSFPEPTA